MRINKYLSKGARWIGRNMIKREEPVLSNFFTGIKEGPIMKIAAPLLGAGIVYYPVAKNNLGFRGDYISQADYIGEAPLMTADAVISEQLQEAPVSRRGGSAAPTLGATGNLVFGLHRARRG